MKQETLMKNINELLEIMPWYVKEYYQAKLVIPYSYKTLYEYLKEYRRFFEWLISDHEELGKLYVMQTIIRLLMFILMSWHIYQSLLSKATLFIFVKILSVVQFLKLALFELKMPSLVCLSILLKKLRMMRVNLISIEMSWLRWRSRSPKIPWLVVQITWKKNSF